MKRFFIFCFINIIIGFSFNLNSQNYYFENYKPFNPEIPSPEAFLGYEIGENHTRHDLIIAYFEKLSTLSNRAKFDVYGTSHEGRKLIMLTISAPENLENLDMIKNQHLKFSNPNENVSNYNDLPVFVQLGYGVHGNEPSSGEAAMLVAYTLVASDNNEILNYLKNSVIFIDPALNPDGRDRHTQWANQYKAKQLVSDPLDAEHNEMWPGGRTNHYWFDLNRDWLLGVHPESKAKLNWYHQWYPNVVTDFHEMGTNSTYFFEPMKPIGSLNPIMPKENYEDLNNLFAKYFEEGLNAIGSFYYTKESFDGTYPGYGSSYPDLQGALAILFEQASSRGLIQDTQFGKITFPFTIRNQFVSSFSTIKAATENKSVLRKYQQDFFKSATAKLPDNNVFAYKFNEQFDKNRLKSFLDFLLLHKIQVYKSGEDFFVPTKQPQRRMVQTMFETYEKYRDSAFYDASAWSVANFYNIKFSSVKAVPNGETITNTSFLINEVALEASDYAYILDWDDYNSSAALYFMQSKGVKVAAAFKPFAINTTNGNRFFSYGSILIPVSRQDITSEKVHQIVSEAKRKFNVPIYAVNTGFSTSGIDLGSNNFRALKKSNVALFIGDGVSSYEAGEVWHLLDTRVEMPVSKIQLHQFNRINWDKYSTIVMVSGRYNQLDSVQIKKLTDWVAKGNTLITIAGASKWAIDKKVAAENLVKNPDSDFKNKIVNRLPYVNASENFGKEQIGGVILKVDLDITHPLGFGYRNKQVPVYKNNTVFISPSKNPYATVSQYVGNPHIDGFISAKNIEFIKQSASLIVGKIGSGRVIMFADNPNFRGTLYGTNKMFLNAIFFGNLITVPEN